MTFQVNVLSQYQLISLVLPDMIQQRGMLYKQEGPPRWIYHFHILTYDLSVRLLFKVDTTLLLLISSSTYAGTKSAISSLHGCLRQELLAQGLSNTIHTLCVYPYILDTQLFRSAMNYQYVLIGRRRRRNRDWFGKLMVFLFPRVRVESAATKIVDAIEHCLITLTIPVCL